MATGGRESCYLSSNVKPDNGLTVFSRLLVYVLWCLPIIYVFRPGVNRKCCGATEDDEGQEMAEFRESFLMGDMYNTST